MKALLIVAALASSLLTTTVTAAAGNTVCSNFIRMAYETKDAAATVERASHPVVWRTVVRVHGSVPPALRTDYAFAYSYNLLSYCKTNPNNGTWEASEYALDEANKEVFNYEM